MRMPSANTASANNTSLEHYEVWFLTGSQHLYGRRRPRAGGSAVAGDRATALDASRCNVPVKLVWKPVLTDSDAIRRTALEANADDRVIGVIAWMHTFSPAKMWIAGLDALRKPLLHLHTQANVELPWADIDFDFMNLNQAAHGDREFGYIQTRLGVPARPSSGTSAIPRSPAKSATWQRALAAGLGRRRTLKLARFGDNMRNVAVTEGDKTEAELRFGVQVNTWGVNELADAVARGIRRRHRCARRGVRDSCTRSSPSCARAATATSRCGTAPRSSSGLRSFLEAGGFRAFTTNFEDLGALRQLPGLAVQRLMADGYGFGAEGDWKTAILVRAAKVMGARSARRRLTHGGLHVPLGTGRARRSWARTCWRSARR
jgi:L-arabinose isomerase